MALTEDDLDRIGDKISIAVMGAVSSAMDRHVEMTHDRCERECVARADSANKRLLKTEEAINGIHAKMAWFAGLLVGLGALWEFFKRKIGL